MFRYLKMKHNEIRVKAILYDTIIGFMYNNKEIIALIQKLYIALKDVPAEELKSEFVKQLAEIIHFENNSAN